jgi:hypothetical protein
MRRIRFFALVFLFSLRFISGAAQALDLRLVGGVGNLAFNPDQKVSLGAAGSRFDPRISPLGHIGLGGEFSDAMDFSVAYERDPLLKNRVLANMGFHYRVVRLDFGPFIGLFNTKEQIISPGVAAALGLEFPGIIFGSLKAASTIGSLASLPGDYVQQTGELALGFWVPHVVCTLSINTKSFTRRESEALLLKDEHIRYQFRADAFTKNVPYTVYLDLGYQSLKRSYIPASGVSATDELKSLYIGFEGTYRIIPSLRVILGAEMPVYAWGEKPLKGPEKNTFLYQFRAGLIWTLPEGRS